MQFPVMIRFISCLKRNKRKNLAQGMLIGAGVIFLLNTACFGILFS